MSCCCQNPEDGAPPSPKEKCTKGEIPDFQTMDHEDRGDFPGKEIYKDEEGIEMFFDAQTDLFSTAVSSLQYAPTSTMRVSVFSSRRVSMQSPQTLLSSRNLSQVLESEEEEKEAQENSEMMQVKKHGKHVRESVIQVTSKLQQRTSGTQGQGYPGELTREELDACLEFRERLKTEHPVYKSMVYAFTPMEEESFALCRVLRGEGYSPQAVFDKFESKNVVTYWEQAEKQNFWHDFEAHFGCPVPVFLKLFPILSAGLAKNGCTILYLKVGDIDIDGIECIADLPALMPYIWHILHEKGRVVMKREIEQTDASTTTVLAEKLVVTDMKGAPSALFGSDGMEFLKDAAKASACFPEILNRMYLVNVPMTFTMVWAVLKYFVDPRTIRKIGFFSNAKKAKNDLLQYVKPDQLLSDYGGDGMSFGELLKARQEEFGEHDRYVVKSMNISKKESNFSFSLANNETIVDLTIYSKNEDGATITMKNDGEVVAGPTKVNRHAAKNGQSKPHYSVSIPVGRTGSGTLSVYGTLQDGSGSAGNFLLAVSIAKEQKL